MYRIMLADDEGIMLDSLKFLLEGEFKDEIRIEMAKSGRAVIELAEHFRPDIAVMDIHMPGINGIEAMQEIRKSNENTVFIVLSAYDKFDYARQAIELGVMEYLNKPVERVRFLSVIKKAMDQIDSQREKRSRELMIREKMETVVPVLESGLIYNLLLKEFYMEDIESYLNLLGIKERSGYMLALVFGDGQEGGHMNNAVGASVRLQDHTAAIREIIKGFFPAMVGAVMANKIAAYVPSENTDPDYNERTRLIEKAGRLVEKISEGTGLLCRVGIGSVVPMNEAVSSYQEALDSMTLTQEPVVLTKDLPVSVGYEENYPIELEKELFDCVERGNLEGAIASADAFYDWMAESYGEYIMDVRLKVLEFVLWSEHLAYHKSGKTYRFRSRKDYLPSLLEIDDLERLKSWFLDKLTDACRNVTLRAQRQTDNVVDKARSYIDENYSRDISLEEVSRNADISAYYFSKLFKEGTGVTFIEYLTKVRIEKAKQLIAAGELSMKEICQQVGYSDPNYFSRIFKKNVGVTPTEYKEKDFTR
ncbi:MAG: response regulator [Lachnospiraceae bacterium]|nr:response regulator [Lachnospiraceae bacterium]